VILSRRVDDEVVTIECDASLEDAAGDVLETLRRLARSGTKLRDGYRMRFGWSVLTLRAEDGGFRVCEPRFSGDPRTELSPTLDTTLAVLVAQVHWLRRLGVQGEDVVFDQQVVLAEGALDASEIFALRGSPTSEADTGWSVASVPAEDEAVGQRGLTALPVHRLVDAAPDLLPILTLPEGYLVTLHEGEVVEITDPQGEVRWAGAEEGP
jgi:hypothetical protein